MEESLTVAELAQAIAQGAGERTDTITRRLRHWTMAGILPPIGRAHSGTGHHRRYSYDAIPIAAILNWLANWSLPITVLARIADLVPVLRNQQRELWNYALTSEVPRVYLGVQAESFDLKAEFDTRRKIISAADCFISTPYKRLPRDQASQEPFQLGLIPEERLHIALDVCEGMILLNLSVLFTRLPRYC